MSPCSLRKQGTELNHWLPVDYYLQGYIYCTFSMYISKERERKGIKGEYRVSLGLFLCKLNKF